MVAGGTSVSEGYPIIWLLQLKVALRFDREHVSYAFWAMNSSVTR
jgi:hypothetical protein